MAGRPLRGWRSAPAGRTRPRRPRGVKYLVLAEGFSADPHYAKTMRGVLRYRRDDVVAILDSARAGVVTQGGHFPPAWMELLRACVEAGLDIENGLHVFLADDPELGALAAARGVELRDLRRPPAGLSTATGQNLAVDATIVLT